MCYCNTTATNVGTTGHIKEQKGLLDFMENLENGTLRGVKNTKANEETEFPTMKSLGSNGAPKQEKKEEKNPQE